MKKIKVAVAGLGRIGKIHLANLRQNFSNVEVAAASDILPESRSFAEQFQVPYFTDSFDELLQVDGLDAVLICSPTDTHADFTVKADSSSFIKIFTANNRLEAIQNSNILIEGDAESFLRAMSSFQ